MILWHKLLHHLVCLWKFVLSHKSRWNRICSCTEKLINRLCNLKLILFLIISIQSHNFQDLTICYREQNLLRNRQYMQKKKPNPQTNKNSKFNRTIHRPVSPGDYSVVCVVLNWANNRKKISHLWNNCAIVTLETCFTRGVRDHNYETWAGQLAIEWTFPCS